jgi:phosphoglucomutase
MPTISHPATGFPVGDPSLAPLSDESLPSRSAIAAAASGLILSASGWRKVFAADGDEESRAPAVAPADLVLAGAAALAFGRFLAAASGLASPRVLVGIDSRPTGPAIADAMIRVFLGLGLEPRYLFIVAAPEIMAYARLGAGADESSADRAAGFCYVSASHNPVGHNGLKFGSGGGGVLGAADSAALIASYKALLAEPDLGARVLALMEGVEEREVARVFSGCQAAKRRSISAYTLFAREVISGSAKVEEQEALFDEMEAGASARPIGVLADLNGSARCLSIDRDFLEGLGVRYLAINDAPREFAHRIVPEGKSLDEALDELRRLHADDPSVVAGYVPDCDGDRGNLVVALGDGVRPLDAPRLAASADVRPLDAPRLAASADVRPLDAQEVFALSCVAELAGLVRSGALGYGPGGEARAKVAVVVNDATSMRVEAIARAFGALVRRAETGEANVVGLAESLRREGYIVRILGEGSNGGNITHPSQVRDPLATLGALLKLLLLRGGEGGLFDIWLASRAASGLGGPASAGADFGIGDILESLPRFATTSVFEERAALRVRTADQAELKARYADIFAKEWESRRAELGRRFGIASWRALATRGQVEEELGAEGARPDFAASGRGGLRIVFGDGKGRDRVFVWMRGSGTEPVFRVMADVESGSAEDEAWFLDWHAGMVRRADAAAE